MLSKPDSHSSLSDCQVINGTRGRELSTVSGYQSVGETPRSVDSAPSDIPSLLLHRSDGLQSVSCSMDDNENSTARYEYTLVDYSAKSTKRSNSSLEDNSAHINQSKSFYESCDQKAVLPLVDCEMELSSISSTHSALTSNESERLGEISLMDTSYSSMYSSSTSTCLDECVREDEVWEDDSWEACLSGGFKADGLDSRLGGADSKLTSNVHHTVAWQSTWPADDDVENRAQTYWQSAAAVTTLPPPVYRSVEHTDGSEHSGRSLDTSCQISTPTSTDLLNHHKSTAVRQPAGWRITESSAVNQTVGRRGLTATGQNIPAGGRSLGTDHTASGMDLKVFGRGLSRDWQGQMMDGRRLKSKSGVKMSNDPYTYPSGCRREAGKGERHSGLEDCGRSLKRIGAGLGRSVATVREGRERMEAVFGERLAEERGREKHLARHRALVMDARKRILLDTLESLKQSLKDQSARLQTAYDLVLTSQWNSSCAAAAVAAGSPAAGIVAAVY